MLVGWVERFFKNPKISVKLVLENSSLGEDQSYGHCVGCLYVKVPQTYATGEAKTLTETRFKVATSISHSHKIPGNTATVHNSGHCALMSPIFNGQKLPVNA